VGAIHGRLLTAWSAGGVAGPLIINGFLDAQGEPGNLTAAAYRPALLTMVGVLAVGFVANLAITRVADKHHEADLDEPAAAEERSDDGSRSARDSASPALLVLAWTIVGVPLVYGVYKIAVVTASLFG